MFHDLPVHAATFTEPELFLTLAMLADTDDMRADSELSARSSVEVDGGMFDIAALCEDVSCASEMDEKIEMRRICARILRGFERRMFFV
jgi:hypothetical protein